MRVMRYAQTFVGMPPGSSAIALCGFDRHPVPVEANTKIKGNGTVEVLTLTPSGTRTVATYGEGQAVASVVFPGFSVPVSDVFVDESGLDQVILPGVH